MTILDLMRKTATIFNIDEVINDSSLDSVTGFTQKDVLAKNASASKLYELAKLLISDIALYSPTMDQQTVKAVGKKMSLSSLHNVIKVISVEDENGPVQYEIVGSLLFVDRDGTYNIKYQKHEDVTSILNHIFFYNQYVTEDLLVVGLNSYYCLVSGLYAEYNVYNAQYVDKLSRIKNLKVFAMPCRRWHD